MKNTSQAPLISDLVLIGGGHAHVHILKMAGMPPLKSIIEKNGIRITLISSTILTPYSGMLPGFIAGHYNEEDIHLDLRKLCSFGNVRFIHAAAIGITYNNENDHDDGEDTARGLGFVQLSDGRPDIRYDTLSIDVGSSPSIPSDIVLSSPMKVTQENDKSLLQQPKQELLQQKSSFLSSITPVKPIATFSKRWANICDRLYSTKLNCTYSSSNPFQLVVVGGGAGGIELALSAQLALQNIMKEDTCNDKYEEDCIQVILVTRGQDLLSSHNFSVKSIFKRILSEKKIHVRYNAEVIGIMEEKHDIYNSSSLLSTPNHELKLSSSTKEQLPIKFHECLFCTSANASSWLTTHTPFETTSDGFVTVKDTYECLNHPGVFAVGDCCHLADNPRPKAGVFAVRAGPIVKDNLIAYLLHEPLTSHQPQSEFLGLISTGEKYAVASRGEHALEGYFLWTLKDEIDRTWMDGYLKLPDMSNSIDSNQVLSDDNKNKDEGEGDDNATCIPPNLSKRSPDILAAFAEVNMRCGGCGAKVGSTTLSRVLDAVYKRRVSKSSTQMTASTATISKPKKPKKIDPDDAAIVLIPNATPGNSDKNGAMIHTIDFFRSFISDPFTFGKVAAVHALSDCHAMGAKAQTALALAVVQYAANESMTESTLIDMLAGACDILDAEECELVGGHTCEGAELALGFAVNGYIEDVSLLLRKQGGKVGDKIILTKAIGTGALFAADMRAKCRGEFVEEALLRMVSSNRIASECAMEMNGSESSVSRRGIRSCTDVTGFGLIGHLLEMLIANDDAEDEEGNPLENISAALYIDKIPFLKGGIEAVQNGIHSSLHKENFRSRRAVSNHQDAFHRFPIKYPLLFDPQTAGGLLFFVDCSVCDDFIDKLLKTGLVPDVSVIGELKHFDDIDDSGTCEIGTVCGSNTNRLHIINSDD
mmetsp:Transcript_22481/g.27554  ORF Transcript_22481/g.27554 Transcript_22481/m.27554 type:complete len:931 (+) Transcript_22481:35-2827(+)